MTFQFFLSKLLLDKKDKLNLFIHNLNTQAYDFWEDIASFCGITSKTKARFTKGLELKSCYEYLAAIDKHDKFVGALINFQLNKEAAELEEIVSAID